MKSIYLNLKVVVQIIKMALRLMRNPNDNLAIFNIQGDAEHPAWKNAVASLKRIPECARNIDGRYGVRQPLNLDVLRSLPPESLGRVYADYLDRHGLDPNFYPSMPVVDDMSYVRKRANQTHDLWHLVSGFDTSLEGEIKVLAISATQYSWPLSSIVIGFSIFFCVFKQPQRIGALFSAVAEGWNFGKSTKPLLAVRWEELWERPFTDVKRELKL